MQNWQLVLTARNIPHRRINDGHGDRLDVPEPFLIEALEQIRLYEQENRNWPPPLAEKTPVMDNGLTNLSLLFLLAIFHNLTLLYPPPGGGLWVDLGNAEAGKILEGEWWRCLTALTLHTGWQHLLGNLVFGSLFVLRLAQEIGTGLTWFLLVLTGASGNLINAALQSPDHRAIGASTALFAAVGLLASLSLIKNRRPLWRRWPLPIAAACGLLAMLGSSGERTDLGAHLFGFLCGLLMGLIVGKLMQRFGRTHGLTNLGFGLLAGLLIAIAWFLAIPL